MPNVNCTTLREQQSYERRVGRDLKGGCHILLKSSIPASPGKLSVINVSQSSPTSEGIRHRSLSMQAYNLTETPTCRMVASYFYTFQMWYVNFEQSAMYSVQRYTQSRIVFFDWYSEELPCVLNTHIASYSRNTASISIWDFPSTISGEEPITLPWDFLGIFRHSELTLHPAS